MPSACFVHNSPCGPPGGRERQDGQQRLRGQISTKLRYYSVQLRWLVSAFRRACSKALGSGENGKRYQQLIKPASPTYDLADRTFILGSNQSSSASLSLSDYNCGATLTATGVVRIHFFPLNLQLGEASGDAPV